MWIMENHKVYCTNQDSSLCKPKSKEYLIYLMLIFTYLTYNVEWNIFSFMFLQISKKVLEKVMEIMS